MSDEEYWTTLNGFGVILGGDIAFTVGNSKQENNNKLVDRLAICVRKNAFKGKSVYVMMSCL